MQCPCCGEGFTANKESESLRARVAELERDVSGAITNVHHLNESNAIRYLKIQELDGKCHELSMELTKRATERDAAIKERDEARAHLIRLHASATKFAAFFEK